MIGWLSVNSLSSIILRTSSQASFNPSPKPISNKFKSMSAKYLKSSKLRVQSLLQVEETPSSRQNPLPIPADTKAQRIPKLPESKFFPSSTKNLNSSLNTSGKLGNFSINSSSNQIIHRTLINPSNQSSLMHESSINISHASPKNETIGAWTELHLPTSPLIVIGKFRDQLSKFELAEILKFPQVFCIGIEAAKHESNGNALENYGFDDESGDYRVALHDHVAYRYEVFEVVGKGSFGQVFRVFDHKHKCFCALKIIKNKKRFTQQALVEIDILRHIRKADEESEGNIVHIQSSFSFRNHIVRSN